MKLFYRKLGNGSPLIILHGLWGSSDNWLPIAHMLEKDFQVFIPDIRNHGQSPHSSEMNYHVMSDDIIQFISEMDFMESPYIVGHSMGGKILMTLLLKRPELVKKAIIIDIAPISYTEKDGGNHHKIIDFMGNFNLSKYKTRTEIKNELQKHFRSEKSQQLFLKNIKKSENGFQWKINYPILKQNFENISGSPENLPFASYDKEILFIKGENSDLIPNITSLQKQFPAAYLIEIPECGHWIHSEQPEKLALTINNYFFQTISSSI